MEISQLSKKIPYEVIDKIFSYDGRIKYKKRVVYKFGCIK